MGHKISNIHTFAELEMEVVRGGAPPDNFEGRNLP